MAAVLLAVLPFKCPAAAPLPGAWRRDPGLHLASLLYSALRLQLAPLIRCKERQSGAGTGSVSVLDVRRLHVMQCTDKDTASRVFPLQNTTISGK